MFLEFHSVILCIVYLYHVLLKEVTSLFIGLRSTNEREQAQLKGGIPGQTALGEGAEKRPVDQHVSCWPVGTSSHCPPFHSTAFH